MTSKAKGYLVLASVFALGMIAGGGVTYARVHAQSARILGAERSELREHRRLGAFARELDLSPDQRDQVKEIMARNRRLHRELDLAMHEECGAPLAEHRAKIEAEIGALLAPEQQERFEALSEKHRRRFLFGGRKGRRGGPHGGKERPGRPPRD